MSEERFHQEVAGLLREAQPELRAGWEARTAAAMGAARPARRPRVRLIAITVGAVVALVGLGFVPFPARGAKGALGRALAAAQQATTLHVIIRSEYNGRAYRHEEWWSSDGFCRTDADMEDGWYTSTDIRTKGRWLNYWTRAGSGPDRYRAGRSGRDGDEPPGLPNPYHYPADREAMAGAFDFLKSVQGLDVQEHREDSLWGGPVDIIEAQGTAQQVSIAYPITHVSGDAVKMRAELDAKTGRLLSLQEWVLDEESGWQRTFWTEAVEWDAEIPQAVRDWQFPAGTTVHQTRWWTERTEGVLAQANTADYEVQVHHLDVNRTGDVYVVLSCLPTPLPKEWWLLDIAPTRVSLSAVDGSGDTYRELDPFVENRMLFGQAGLYHTVILRPDAAAGAQGSVTITVRLTRRNGSEQSVTLPAVPLPARQDVVDLCRAAEKTVKY